MPGNCLGSALRALPALLLAAAAAFPAGGAVGEPDAAPIRAADRAELAVPRPEGSVFVDIGGKSASVRAGINAASDTWHRQDGDEIEVISRDGDFFIVEIRPFVSAGP